MKKFTLKALVLVVLLTTMFTFSYAQGEDFSEGDILEFVYADTLWAEDGDGVRAENDDTNIGYCKDGNVVVFNSVNFKTAATYLFTLTASHPDPEGQVTGFWAIYIDDVCLDSLMVTGSGAWDNYVPTEHEITIPMVVEGGVMRMLMHSIGPYLGNFQTMYYEIIDGTEIVGVNDNQLGGVKVYPNPTSDNVTIDLSYGKKAQISICNVVGQEVYSASSLYNSTTINTSEFNSGLYFVQIRQGDLMTTKKLIIE